MLLVYSIIMKSPKGMLMSDFFFFFFSENCYLGLVQCLCLQFLYICEDPRMVLHFFMANGNSLDSLFIKVYETHGCHSTTARFSVISIWLSFATFSGFEQQILIMAGFLYSASTKGEPMLQSLNMTTHVRRSCLQVLEALDDLSSVCKRQDKCNGWSSRHSH